MTIIYVQFIRLKILYNGALMAGLFILLLLIVYGKYIAVVLSILAILYGLYITK